MGSSTLIDMVGSILISGFLLLAAVQLDEKSIQNTFDSQVNLTVQQNMTSLVEDLEYDFRKIGYCENAAKLSSSSANIFIQKGDTSKIWFLTDASNVGNVDTVKYWLGTTAIPGSANPSVRMLYRQVNSNPPTGSNLGVTQFNLKYFGTLGTQLSTPFGAPNQAQVIEVTVEIEATSAYDTNYSSNFATWRQTRLVSRNMKR